MDTATALFMGLLQGVTELFPISSLGHAVVVPPLLHLGIRQTDDTFLPFLVLLHIGTGLALLLLYRDTWVRIVQGFVRAAVRGRVTGEDERLAMLLVAGTIPTGLIGFLFEKSLKHLFATPRISATFLIANAAVLLAAELFRRRDERRSLVGAGRQDTPARSVATASDKRHSLVGAGRQDPPSHGGTAASAEHDGALGDRTVADPTVREAHYARVESLTVGQVLAVGACQSLALLPGISRAGITMAAGLVVGLRHQEAARLSFLLATPIILAAGVFEIGDLLGTSVPLASYVAAAAVAGSAAYLSARFLLRYFRVGRLDPYAWYCGALGVVALILVPH